MTQTVLAPDEFADAIEQHYVEASDDARKVVVGLQEESHEAEIYARFEHLYSPSQLAALGEARDAATDPGEREQLTRLWFEAADALAAADVVQAAQDLTNDRLGWRCEWQGEQVSYNTLGALIASEEDFERREQLFELMCQADEHFAPRDLELAVRSSELRSATFGIEGEVAIATARMGIDVRAFSAEVNEVAARTADRYAELADRIFPELLGRDERLPSRAHAAHMRSLHVYDDIYTQERMVDVCERTVAELGFPLEQIPTILPDLEDRPQKSPRACVIATRVPQEVHLVVRPTGGITDYQAFLHEAGHALHFGLTDAELPFAWRYVAPDNALTEIYSYVVERITHQPAWHMRHFGLSREQAEDVCAHCRFIDATLFRRYAAKLAYELEFWADPADPRNPERYAMGLSAQTRMRYPTSQYVVDIDPGLYAADYLRAWRTSEQVIDYLAKQYGEEWFADPAAGTFLRELFVQGTRPTNEEVSEQVGSSAHDYEPLVRHLT
jgi:hypothetical protein